GRTLQLACPEKALIDLLYLYPFYNTRQALEDLRLDEDFSQSDLDQSKLEEYTLRFNNKALDKRIQLLITTYNL
ncbi:unnamed protein product, partial [marine sediment metagenome]